MVNSHAFHGKAGEADSMGKIIVCLMLTAFFALWLTLSPVRLALTATVWIMSLWLVRRYFRSGVSFDKRLILLEPAIMLFSAVRFYEYWMTSGTLKQLINSVFSIESGLFLVIAALLIIAVSFYGVYVLLYTVRNTGFFQAIRRATNAHPLFRNLIIAAAAAIVFFLQFQRSSLDFLPNIYRIKPLYFIVNYAAIFLITLVTVLVVRRERLGIIILSTLVTMFCIANYYVILFHGSPLFPSEFANMKTAANVISGYKYTLSPQLVDLAGLYFLGLYLAGLCAHTAFSGVKLRGYAVTIICAAAAAYIGLLSPAALKNAWLFSWNASVMYGGFICSAANDVKSTLHPFYCPEGYSAEKIRISPVDNSDSTSKYPDIILILNESFADLDYYSDVQADRDYLGPFYGIENASYGISFSPNIGGGTNDSEFELLTSDSMALMASSTPFNYVRFNEKNSTLISYLKSLGYTTTAMHNSTPYNYSRHVAYPAMGFDHVYLGSDSFSETNYYGKRPVLDKDDYDGMISLYENDTDGPQFYFLLTYQNHGGYEQNDASMDAVHTQKDFGGLTDDINEYLSSAALSAQAFKELTDYYKNSDRPVVLCMVGDHAPSFISQMPANRDMSFIEEELWKRAVPFVIWCNFEYEHKEETMYCSMTDLVPMLLSSAKMPLTPYYNELLAVRSSLPVRTRFGIFMDKEGNIFEYDREKSTNDRLTQYYYMEYNGITASDDYCSVLFKVTE